MSTDLNELKDLVATLKADQQAQKDREAKSAWTKYVALSMIFLAVLSATATQRGGGYSSTTMKQLNEATFNQAKASDQWAFFQAKGIKQSIFELERERAQNGSVAVEPKVIAGFTARIDRYESEKKDITKEATALEAKRDAAIALATSSAASGREMGLASTLFQIAIALGGVCLVVKKRWLWYASMGVGAIAVLQMLRVILMK
jgi:hypothetical protein